MRFGIQLFGLNPVFKKNPEEFLCKAQQMHYRYLEPCFALQTIPGLEDRIWTPEDFRQYRPLLQKYGFKTNSCHVFSQNPLSDAEKLSEIAFENGISHLVFPCPFFSSEDQGKALAEDFRKLCRLMKSKGLEVLLHNNKDECVLRIGELSAYEWFLHETGAELGAQADVGWLLYGGVDPESFLWRNKDQVHSIHYKDMDLDEKTGELIETGVGKGLVDFTSCFQFARAQELIQIIDQDIYSENFYDDLKYVAGKFSESVQCRENTRSILCVYDVESGTVRKLHEYDRIIEAPNWMQTDSDTLIYNSEGRIWRYSVSKDTEEVIPTGHCTNCNNDHVLSPDNTQIAVSHSETGWMSQIYICTLDGSSEPVLITPKFPSFLHGWSFDSQELAYCAFRGADFEHMAVDIYSIPATGGEEKQLTHDAGFNDGPEYAPNNKDLWFISTRSGLMQCWKMNRDGTCQTQMTFTERNNWFPHISPDGKQVVYLSYSKDGLDPNEHLSNMQVQLRMMDYDGSNDRCILEFFGGQGSLNVNSWKADSKQFAFVMYELCHK